MRVRTLRAQAVAIGACLGAAPAVLAADLPIKPPVLKAAPVETAGWTGFYVNGGAGYGLWAADTSVALVPGGGGNPALPFVQRQGGRGYLGVVGGGFDYQFTPRLVGGVFADFDFANLKGTVQDAGPFFGGTIKEDRAWAVGARGGYLVNPGRLTYVNAGYTNAHFSSAHMANTVTLAPLAFSTPAFSRGGYFVGGGTESSFAPNWYWRTEYRLAYYGNQVLTDTNGTGLFVNNINFKPTVQTITTQLVYKYNPGIPGAVTDAPAPSLANWTGVYVNGGGGYGIWAADTTVTAVPGSGNPPLPFKQRQGGKGYLGVVGGGFDYQFAPRLVAGAFGEYDIAGLKGTIQDQGPFFAGNIKETSAWAAGVRGGFLISSDIMSYVNAGYTNAHFSSTPMVNTATLVPSGFATPAFSTGGYFIGAGIEAALAAGWFWRTEYRVSYYGNQTLTDTNGAGLFVNNINFKPTMQTATTQLVYKFNWNR